MGTNSNKLKLTDLVDVRILQKIQDDFAMAMDLSCTIMDPEAIPLTKASNTRWLCHGLIRKTKKGDRRCRQSDKECGQQAVQIRGPVIHTCHAGLTDFAVPIEVDGSLIAYMFGGQVLPEKPDLRIYRQKAEKLGRDLGIDPKDYLKGLKEVPILSMDRIEAAARLMRTVANTISDKANETIKAQQRAKDWTTSLHQIGLALVSDLTLPEVLEKITENALNVLDADVVTLYQYSQEREDFVVPPVMAGELRQPLAMHTRVHEDDIVARIVRAGESHYAPDAEEDEFLLGPWGTTVPARDDQPERLRFTLREGIKSSAGVLLKVVDEVVGVMFVNYREPRRFTEDERRLIETFAHQAAIAIHNARLFERTQRNLTQLEVLHKIKERIDSALDLDGILQATLTEGLRAVRTDEGSIMLVNLTANELEIKAWLVKGAFVPEKTHRKLALGEGIAGYVATTGEVYNCPDVSKDSHYTGSPFGRSIRSLLSVPIISHGRVLGIINTDSAEPGFFKEDDVHLLSALAGHVAVAIESQRLRDIGMVLSTLSPDEMLAEIVESACMLTGTESSTIFLIDERSGDFVRAARFPSSEEMGVGPRTKEGLTRLVVDTGEPVVISDAQRDSRVRQSVKDQGVKSIIGVPLQVRVGHDDMPEVRAIGILFVNTTRQREFGSRDVELLQSLASQAAIAIERARLFEHTRSDLDRRVEELSALAEIDDAITTSDLDIVLEKIVKTAVRLIGVDDVTLLLVDESGKYLVPRAKHGAAWQPGSPDKFPIGKLGVSVWVAKNKRTARISDVRSEEWKDIYVEVRPETQSELAVPLLDESGRLVGIINLESPKLKAFSEDDQRLLEALAKQAVIAIQNQKRYEAEQRARRELEVISEIDRAISSTLDLEEVLSLILDKGLELVKAPHGNIMLLDKIKGDLWMAAGRGTMLGREGARQEIGNGIVGLVAKERKPLRVSDVTEAPWRNIYLRFIEGIKSELAVPMVYDGILVGVLNAESPERGDFSADDQRLLEALATQAVIAIRNAELHQEVIDRAQALANLHEVGRDITIALDLAKLSQSIAGGATQLINADTARMYLYDGDRFFSPTAEADGIPPSWMPKDHGLVTRAVGSRKPVIVEDVESEPLCGEVVKTEGIRSFICYPLLMGNKVVGVLYVNYHKPHSFTKDELETIGAFASQASIAIQNAEQTQELAMARERFQRLYEAAQEIIRAELNERSILGAPLRIGMERTGAFSASARLLDASGKRLETVECLGKAYDGTWKPIAVGKGVNGWVAEHREKLLVDVADMPEEIGAWEGHSETRWKLVVPMMVGDEYSGNLGFDSASGERFEEDEIRLIEGIAAQAAAALQRLRERRRAEEAELRKAAMDQLTMLQTLRTNLLHGFRARRLVPFQTMTGTLRRQLDKGIDEIDREIVYKVLDSIQQAAQESFEDLQQILNLPTKEATERATLVDINVQVQGAYRYTLDSKPENVQVEFSFAEDLPRIMIDPFQLSIIFENLFVNAYEALKDWDGERRLALTIFKAPGDEGVTKVGAKFGNTGPPVPDDVARQLCKEPIGEGMGLYTSAWVLALYGGRLSLTENQPGRVTFVVEFDVKGGQ